MKIIGLIGGIGWQSSLEYYRIINGLVALGAGKSHSARIIINSLDFHDVETLADSGNMEGLSELVCHAAVTLEKAGADCVMIGANTMHMFAAEVGRSVDIPLIHIIEATGREIIRKGLSRVGLLGTRQTMEMPFYSSYLKDHFNVETLVPDSDERIIIHQTIFDELFHGVINPESRRMITNIIQRLELSGAEGVILGCTEIPLLVKQNDVSLLLFDTTEIHARAAVDFALNS